MNIDLILKEPLKFGAKAACFLDGKRKTVWLALSQIEFDYRAAPGDIVDVDVQDWVASKNRITPVKQLGKGWTDGMPRRPSRNEVSSRLDLVIDAQKKWVESDRLHGCRIHEINRLDALLSVIDSGANFECHKDGLVLVDGQFEYSLTSGKWRKLGKGKWYHSQTFSHFLSFVGRDLEGS